MKDFIITMVFASLIMFPVTCFNYTYPHAFDWLQIKQPIVKGKMWVRQRSILPSVEVCKDCSFEQARIIAGNNSQLELVDYF
jgi:hypothetical protein